MSSSQSGTRISKWVLEMYARHLPPVLATAVPPAVFDASCTSLLLQAASDALRRVRPLSKALGPLEDRQKCRKELLCILEEVMLEVP